MAQPGQGTGGSRQQQRLLIVPGDLVDGEVRESFLDRASFTVRTAASAREAIAIAAVWQPTLVAFRSSMRGMSTARFVEDLREASGAQGPRLLMLTDKVGDPREQGYDVQCDAHLVSPMEMRELLDTMAGLVQVHQRRSPRVALEVLVQLEGFSAAGHLVKGEGAMANSINVSEDGMLLECNRQLTLGSRGKLVFFLPDSPDRVEVSGEVRMAIDEVRLHYALEFGDPSPYARKLLHDYVESQVSPP